MHGSRASEANCASISTGTANDRTIIEGDINGNRVADFQIQLTGLNTLTATDFVL